MSYQTEEHLRSLQGEPGAAVRVAMTDVSAATAESISAGRLHVITCPSALHIAIGDTATVNDTYWPANTPFFVTLRVASQIAFIKAAGADNATVFITPMTGNGV